MRSVPHFTPLLIGFGIVVVAPSYAFAQSRIIPDNTLGAEQSQVIQNFNGSANEVVTGGATRGQNLFHSFQEFNISEGRGAFFLAPSAGIQNILARVTGNTRSEILGTLGTFRVDSGNIVPSNANLFLINPNGILFGPNATLNIGGSFVATTANALQFGDQGFFSATNPEIPSSLLTINPSAFLFNQITPAPIQSNAANLAVSSNQGLLFLGGDVILDRSQISISGGSIHLGGIVGQGAVGLIFNNNLPQFSFPLEGITRSDISLVNRAGLVLTNPGNIIIHANKVTIANASKIITILASDTSLSNGRAGDVEINAAGTVNLDSSLIASGLVSTIGNSGNIRVVGQTVNLVNGSGIGSFSVGQGDSGKVTIQADDIIAMYGRSANGTSSSVFSSVASVLGFTGSGNGSDINLQAREIRLSDGAQLTTTIFSEGEAGSIEIDVVDNLLLTGEFTGIQASTRGQGNAGNISIRAGNDVSIFGNAGLATTTSGQGNAGNISIRAGNDVSLSSDARLLTETSGQGNAGNISIYTSDSVLLDGASSNNTFISSTVNAITTPTPFRRGGDIFIDTGSLRVNNIAQLRANSFGQGNAGNIIINARDTVSLNGGSADGRFLSGAFSNVESGAVGSGGDIRITTGSLSLTNGAQLNAITRGQGNAGNVIISARDTISLDGRSADGQFGSSVASSVESGAVGTGGGIRITTGSLSLTNGAQLSADTRGQGNAGNVIISARDTVSLDGGSNVFSSVGAGAIGNGGDIRITTGSLSLTNVTALSASTFGRGDAGSVVINAHDTVSLDGSTPDGQFASSFASSVESGAVGSGGDIRITTGSLSLTNGAQLNAITRGQGNAGNVIISARDTISLDGRSADGSNPSSIFSTVGQMGRGRGGTIRLSVGSLSITDGAILAASTLGQGRAGNIVIRSRSSFFLDGVNSIGRSSGLFARTRSGAAGRGGDITITTNSFHISNGAIINAQTSNAFRGGNVTINANTFEATSGGQVITTTANRGQAGNITLNIRDNFLLSSSDPTFAARQRRFPNAVDNQGNASGLFASTGRNSRGQGGTIRINTDQLRVEDRARVEVNSLGSGAAGDVQIQARSVRLANEGRLIAETQTVDGGSIFLTGLEQLVLREQSSISTNAGTTGRGDGGNIGIDADFIVAVPSENSDITANAVRGDGGRVEVTTQGLFGIAPREFLTPLSDITASSEQGVQGVVAVNIPNVDPRQGLLELPTDVIDATQQIAQNCPAGDATASELGEFVITGRGGLPPNPIEVLGSETVLTQLANTDSTAPSLDEEAASENPQPIFIEAQGWVVDANGSVMLVARNPHSLAIAPGPCGT
jgi:filamentous hemagglutinin family protein